jgi:NhaP-type Na+/H+ or K+/H+ antiporter
VEALVIAVLALLAIAVSTQLGPRVGVATPLILVGLGWLASLPSFVPDVEVDPEWIIAGILPPLLYGAAVSMPTTEFRREFRQISGLSVALVVITTLGMGFFLHWLIPDLALPWAFALGAILSPTDPVAIGIVKKLGISPRVIALLEGESLLNDATALVLLRTAVGAAAAAAFAPLGIIGDLIFAIAVAVVIGWVVGWLNVRIRARVQDPTVNTVISFTVPFLASIPAELLHASGLVAAVVAGLVTGASSTRRLSPQHRISDLQNWRTVELLLEGAVYLIMGLELTAVIHDVQEAQTHSVASALGFAGLALLAALVLRAGYTVPLLLGMRRAAERARRLAPRLNDVRDRLDAGETLPQRKSAKGIVFQVRHSIEPDRDAIRRRIKRYENDVDYMLRQKLGWREGAVVVWAGMRGVATIAASQTLPSDTPGRSLLILIAFFVAIGSLVIQGGTVGYLVRWVKPAMGPGPEEEAHEQRTLDHALADIIATQPRPLMLNEKDARLAHLKAEREALLQLQQLGAFSSVALASRLHAIDVEQLHLEL